MEDLGRGLNRIAIIGAGWAGLSAAVELAGRGVPVSVFEASRAPGGRARSVALEGIELDNGQHVLIGAYRETLAMMRRVGAAPERLLFRIPLQLCFAEGFHLRAPRLPSPLNLLLGLLAARGLRLNEALAAMRFMSALKADGFRVDPDRSVSSLLDAHRQTGALRRFLWEPLCISALNTRPEEASAQVFANVLRDGLGGSRAHSDLLLPRASLGKLLPEPAARFVQARAGEIEFGAAVRRIRRDPQGFLLDGRPQFFDAVIVACAPQHASALLAEFPQLEPTRRRIDSLTYQPIVTCYLKFPEMIHLPVPMLGFSAGLVQWAFDRGQITGMRGLIAAVVSASGAHEEVSQPELAKAAHAELARAIRNLPQPEWSRVIVEKRATFTCAPTLERPAVTTPIPGLLLAGDYTASDYPGTLEAAVRSGIAAAQAVLAAPARI